MSMVSALAIRESTEALAACEDRVEHDTSPLAARFERLRSLPIPWLLDSESAEGPAARFSFMGADPYLVVRAWGKRCAFETRRLVVPGATLGTRTAEGDPLELALAAIPALDDTAVADASFDVPPPLLAGAVGYLGYELGEYCEPVHTTTRDDFELPDLLLLYNDRIAVFDHETSRVYAIGLGFAEAADLSTARVRAEAAAGELERSLLAPDVAGEPKGSSGVPPARWVLGRELPAHASESLGCERYAGAVGEVRDEIAAGNVYQANLTQRVDLPTAHPPATQANRGWQLHKALRQISPAPFAAYLSLPEVEIVSSSPERFLRLEGDGTVESRPIKGTRRRGASPEEDVLLAKELEASQKDRAENLMIVDLVRNDLGRVCETGSVEVPDLMAIETYATVFQMVSTVRGRLRAECTRADLLRATFPPGSMTGAPKIAAMELIDRIEPVRRGIYSGAIGYFDARGGLDLSVVIRTLLVRDGQVHMHGGGAVVSDSEPEAEYREALDKMRALLGAVACCK
ncbi:MAG: aminodeoxychorismate synthase component I [Myxococcota bacterium]|jgi:aminodeoxychorismate synthase component I|nr:aminodeoxychorismate synthase component I [Myxococcota bacterium]